MQVFTCQGCGSHDFHEENGYRICEHCGTKHIITAEDQRASRSTIDLQEDVARLLEKCKEEPERAKKFATRILEIDPNNAEAQRILNANLYQTKKASTSGGCYVATAVYGSYDCPQVWTLRRFRDDTLAETWYGRAFIHTYYAVSPTLVRWFGKVDWFRNLWKPTLDKMVDRLNRQGVADTPYFDKRW